MRNSNPEKKWFKKLEKQFDNAVKHMAEEMTYQIQAAYESAIQEFYNDYYPAFYNRTYSTYQGSNRWNNAFAYTDMGSYLESGIYVDPQFIPGNPYRAEKDWVFDRTFNQGIHGFTLQDMQEWIDRRIKIRWATSKTKATLAEYRRAKQIKSWEKAGKLHMIQAQFDLNKLALDLSGKSEKEQEAYAYHLKLFRGANLTYNIQTKVPHTMRMKTYDYDENQNLLYMRHNKSNKRNSPRRMMDAKFANITKKKNMRKMFDDILDQYINV